MRPAHPIQVNQAKFIQISMYLLLPPHLAFPSTSTCSDKHENNFQTDIGYASHLTDFQCCFSPRAFCVCKILSECEKGINVIEKNGENEWMVSERSEDLVKTAEYIKAYLDKQEQYKAHYE